MTYYAEGIRKAQKELGLQVDSFTNLHIWNDHAKLTTDGESRSSYDTIESVDMKAQRNAHGEKLDNITRRYHM